MSKKTWRAQKLGAVELEKKFLFPIVAKRGFSTGSHVDTLWRIEEAFTKIPFHNFQVWRRGEKFVWKKCHFSDKNARNFFSAHFRPL
jgi:hypothetical protein